MNDPVTTYTGWGDKNASVGCQIGDSDVIMLDKPNGLENKQMAEDQSESNLGASSDDMCDSSPIFSIHIHKLRKRKN